MGYRIYQETILKTRLAGAYVSKIIEFTLVVQVFIFSFYFTQVLKKEGFNPIIYSKSYFHKDLTVIEKHHEELLLKNYQLPLIYSSSVWFLPFFIFFIFKNKEADKKKNEHRGAKLVGAKELIKSLDDYRDKYLKIGGYNKEAHILTEEDDINLKRNKKQELDYRKYVIEIPEKFEFAHFCIIGRSGSGKTSLINPLVAQIIKRGDRAIIHDYKQDYFRNFYTEDMLIFNPAIPELCLKWNIFNDIQNNEDIIAIAYSLIPAVPKNDPFWDNGSRDILIACLIYLMSINQKTNKAIYYLVNCSNDEIREHLLGCPETLKYAHVFDKSNAKTLSSLMTVFRTYVRCFDYLKDIDGGYSIKKWTQTGTKTIIVMNDESIREAISPSLALFIDMTSRALLMIEDREDRTAIILDEFGRLGRLNSIMNLLTNGRSKGACIYLAAQELSQIDERYGENGRSTIINACTNQVFFGVNDGKSAKQIAEQMGDEETLIQDESIQHRTEGEQMDGLNIRNHKQTKLIVLPSEIQNLKEREFFIKIANNNWSKSKAYIQKKEVER